MNTIYAIIFYLLTYIMGPGGVAELPNESGIASNKVKAAHRYHGLHTGKGFSIEDVNGDQWFMRDGKRCKLFTDAFLKKWERN